MSEDFRDGHDINARRLEITTDLVSDLVERYFQRKVKTTGFKPISFRRAN